VASSPSATWSSGGRNGAWSNHEPGRHDGPGVDDQEALAREFEHYHYLGLPVVDEAGVLVGVVKASDAIEIARKEATETCSSWSVCLARSGF